MDELPVSDQSFLSKLDSLFSGVLKLFFGDFIDVINVSKKFKNKCFAPKKTKI